MNITVNINTTEIKRNGKTTDGYSYDTLKFKYVSGHRIYCTGIKNGIPMQEVIKIMKLEDGKVYLSFNKDKIEIGTYEEVAS